MSFDALWSLIDSHDLTVRTRSIAFVVISKAMALVEKTLARPHRETPFSLFLLLENPNLAEPLTQLRECRLQRWTLKFRTKNPLTDQLTHDKLLLLAFLLYVHTVMIEVGHGRIRRVVKSRAQAVKIDFTDLSAEWIAMQFFNDPKPQPVAGEPTVTSTAPTTSERKRKTSGGGWRVSHLCTQFRIDGLCRCECEVGCLEAYRYR